MSTPTRDPQPTTPPELPPVRPLGPPPGTGSRPGPTYADPTGLHYDRGDDTTTGPMPLPAGIEGWSLGGRTLLDDPVDLTPEMLGVGDDPVAHALHYLAPYGDLTYTAAAQRLSVWERRGELGPVQVAEVLAYYLLTPTQAVA